MSERCSYLDGDFMELAEQISPQDITLLDKVFCCYPDALGLIQASAPLTRKIYAFTLPRDTIFNRIGEKAAALLMRIHYTRLGLQTLCPFTGYH